VQKQERSTFAAFVDGDFYQADVDKIQGVGSSGGGHGVSSGIEMEVSNVSETGEANSVAGSVAYRRITWKGFGSDV